MDGKNIQLKKEAILSTITKKIQTIPTLLLEEEIKLGWEREHSRSLLKFLSYKYIYKYDEFTIQNHFLHDGGHNNNNILENDRVVDYNKSNIIGGVNMDNYKQNPSPVTSLSSQPEIVATNFQADTDKNDNSIRDNLTQNQHNVNRFQQQQSNLQYHYKFPQIVIKEDFHEIGRYIISYCR